MRRKKRDFAAEIDEMEQKVKKAEGRVKDLKEKLKEIKKDRDAEVHQALAAAMTEKNLDINDVLKLVKGAASNEKPEKKGKK